MIQRNYKKADAANSRQGHDRRRLSTYALMIVCALMLVSGFFLAGRQHFSSMDYGMKNSRLRKQIDDLEVEKRRLLMTREVALSPAEIKKAIKKNGLFEMSAADGQLVQVASVTKEKAVPPAPSQMKPMIVKTASVAPIRSGSSLLASKLEKAPRKEVRKTLPTE